MKRLGFFLLCMHVMYGAVGQAQQVLPLYEGKVPHEIPGPNLEKEEIRPDQTSSVTKVRQPTLTIYQPAAGKANGTAIVICPGGGYTKLAFSHEGTDVARLLADQGVTAVVLKYRLPDPAIITQPEITPLQDAQQALYRVRKMAKTLGVHPERVGILGFSAGGHLASTAGTQYGKPQIPNPENLNLRPDFLVLVYPVISSDSTVWHKGSYTMLLGKNPSAEKLKAYSNDLQVTAQTPPTFLVHASDDKAVPVQNSLLFYQALVRHKVPAELHVYQRGGHGFGLKNKTTPDVWFDRLVNWLASNHLLAPGS